MSHCPLFHFLGEQLSGEQLSGEQLSGVQLSGKQLSGEHLSSEQLSGEQLSSEQLSEHRDLHSLADHITNFTKEENRDFSAFQFDQALTNLIVCLMISHKKVHTKVTQTS